MQFNLFDAPKIHAAPALQTNVVYRPAVPIKTLKSYNPNAKKFYWDGTRFGIMSMGAILWFVYHKGKRLTGWVPFSKGEQPESYTEHLFKDARTFTAEAIS